MAILPAKIALLELLRDEQERYGLEMIELIYTRSLGMVKLGQGSVYPALGSLVSKKLMRVTRTEPCSETSGGRQRKYYQITKKGLQIAEKNRRIIASLFGLIIPDK